MKTTIGIFVSITVCAVCMAGAQNRGAGGGGGGGGFANAYPQRPPADPAAVTRGRELYSISNAPETYMLDGHQYLLAAAGDTRFAFTLY